MCSYSIMKILFFILLQLTGIYSTQEISLENDITKHINKWVASTFTSTISGENVVTTISAIHETELMEFEYNIIISNQARTKYTFQDVVYPNASPRKWCYGIQIEWKSSESKIRAFFQVLPFCMNVLIQTDEDNYEKSSQVPITATFLNATSTASRSYTKHNGLKITYDFTYSKVAYWRDDIGGPFLKLTAEEAEEKNQLDRVILPILPTILRERVSTNQKTIQELDDVFQEYEKPRQEIISIWPDFLNNSQKYYYLIPEILFFCFVLKRIVIHGLSNFESYKTHRRLEGEPEIFTHTLLIGNIRGSMTLDYRSEQEKSLKLNFQIDCFNLTKKDDTDFVYGHAKDYTITRANTNVSLSSLQSEVIMNRLESALASALLGLPSEKTGQISDLERALEKIEISNSSDWKTIKESCKAWIPFHDDE